MENQEKEEIRAIAGSMHFDFINENMAPLRKEAIVNFVKENPDINEHFSNYAMYSILDCMELLKNSDDQEALIQMYVIDDHLAEIVRFVKSQEGFTCDLQKYHQELYIAHILIKKEVSPDFIVRYN